MNNHVRIIEPVIKYSDIENKILPKKRVCAYCRVSTDSEEQQKSYKAQVDEFKSRIRANPDWEDAGVYADEGISGTNAKKRPQFQQMLTACRDGKIDMIITKSISRFARNTLDCIETVRKLKTIGVEVFF